jgi:hypothetical protein
MTSSTLPFCGAPFFLHPLVYFRRPLPPHQVNLIPFLSPHQFAPNLIRADDLPRGPAQVARQARRRDAWGLRHLPCRPRQQRLLLQNRRGELVTTGLGFWVPTAC